MFSSLSRYKAVFSVFALTVAISLSTGCCIQPYNNMRVRSFAVEFLGFSLKPNERIEIQAKGGIDPLADDEWETVGELWTDSEPSAKTMDGVAYFGFASRGLRIPRRCWDRYGDSHVTAIRCVNSDGRVLFTADESVVEAGLEVFGLDLIDAWMQYGNRKDYITVWKD
ncbi:MAG: hypothetical protein GY818_04825 [Planctomycetaceae bacterium]|nr:hypothetical protein [Planctomycetaceae bacterium]